MSELILGKNTAHDYTLESTYYEYLENRIQQELRINQLISECSIMNEANTGIITKTKKIAALHEAGFGDKIKAKFNQFIQFLKNIWGKFMANMTKVLADEQTYLKKYADIIQNKKGNPELKVSYYGDYNKGVQRINQVMVPTFDWNSMNQALSDSDNAYGKFFALNKITGMQGFDYDENTELAAQLKDFFIGGEEGQTDTTMDKMDLKTMYNYCWNFKKIEQITKKDINNMGSSATKIQQTIAQNIKDNSSTNPNTNIQNTTNGTETTKPDSDQKQQGGGDNGRGDNAVEPQLSSFIDYGLLKYLTEGEENQQSQSEDEHKAGSTTLNISKGAGSLQDGRLDDNQKQQLANSQSNDAMNSIKGKDSVEATKLVDTVVNNYITICKAVITAKWTAAEQIAKDYMKIINMHVKSYVGKNVDKDNKAAKAQRYETDESKQNKNRQQNQTNNDQKQQDKPAQGQQQTNKSSLKTKIQDWKTATADKIKNGKK